MSKEKDELGAKAELEVQAYFAEARAGKKDEGPQTAEEWGIRDFSKTQRTNMEDPELVSLKRAIDAEVKTTEDDEPSVQSALPPEEESLASLEEELEGESVMDRLRSENDRLRKKAGHQANEMGHENKALREELAELRGQLEVMRTQAPVTQQQGIDQDQLRESLLPGLDPDQPLTAADVSRAMLNYTNLFGQGLDTRDQRLVEKIRQDTMRNMGRIEVQSRLGLSGDDVALLHDKFPVLESLSESDPKQWESMLMEMVGKPKKARPVTPARDASLHVESSSAGTPISSDRNSRIEREWSKGDTNAKRKLVDAMFSGDL